MDEEKQPINESPSDKSTSPFGRQSEKKLPPQEDSKEEKETSTPEELLPHIRTMKYDVQHYVKEKNLSFSDLVAKQQQKQSSEPFVREDPISEKGWFRGVLGLILLIVLGIGGYGGFVLFTTRNTLPAEEAPPAKAFIVVEDREVITVRDGDRAGLLQKIEASRRDRLPSRSIKHVVIRLESFGGGSRFATIEDFFSILKFQVPSGFMNNLEDKFDLLVYYRPDGANTALILDAKDDERALSHMLSWESSIMFDFRNLYFDDAVTQPSQLFEDTVIRNIDVRTLALGGGLTFSYGIFAEDLLLLSTSEEFLEILINRLFVSPPR
ncbi:MAG: hypothetical protein COU90_03770 [Candidatus Ryanbacteria bacterium CG10_big_fil_rev_8_21_14_0_10_43_42]|uniref:Uncharacterized protein n=1 Tax=Candidatus Ryanbacteria bacterium CG10_big_fil_rev_8_21_14_0_10_43_42 TaxID=1974864 RepID=A0A2M8KW99_9BACT|nr:MAG: hypothetical protein COU90_03770 [Candidatus Ryanbacteria bacterium CG10_big_fil_rev_8_21_14_0_10_43_42]